MDGERGDRSMANFLVENNANVGIGSLRDAIMDANTAPGLDTIVFDTSGLFATPQTISLLDELPAITDGVDINGTTSAMLTIQRDPGAAVGFRIFLVENAAATTPISVIISGLTLSGGDTGLGGGIRSVGENLSLDGVVVSGNDSFDVGGGIYFAGLNGSTLSITHSSIIGNSALFGGGLYIDFASVLLGDDTISGNTAIGSAMFLAQGSTTATLNVSTGSATIAGSNAIAGLGALAKAGAGMLVLADSNSYGGGTTLEAGTLDLAALQAAGSGIITFATGSQTLRIENAALAGLVFAPGATVTYDTSSHLLAVTSNGITDMLTLTNPASTHFIAASDGAGGTKVLLGAAVLHDFNADGNSDVLWRQDGSGQVYVWEMNGQQVQAEGTVAHAPVTNDWHVQGTGDFNGDGDSDVLWRQDGSGQIYVWEMNGQQVQTEGAVAHAPLTTDWHVQGVGDFNGDGNSDVLWRQDGSGQVYVWEMNGQQVQAEGAVAHVPVTNDWHAFSDQNFII